MPDDVLQYMADVTIQDWTGATPNENLGDKTWRVRNAGTTTWGPGYMLVHDRGDQMGAPDSVPLPALAPNEEGEVTVPSIVAPATPGFYITSWIPRNAMGRSFSSNLTIVINVNQSGWVTLPSADVTTIAQELVGYGITLVPANWTVDEAERVRNMVVDVGDRLFEFAKQHVPVDVLKSPQQVFKEFFPRFALRRDPADEKLFGCTDPNDESTCKRAYAWNAGGSITIFSNAIFTGTRKIRNQSQFARFAVTFTTEFLVLHELCHSHPWEMEYEDTTQPLVDMVAEALDGTRFSVATATIASAGFKQGARSQKTIAEFSTDAIANWLQESFTGPDDGDIGGFGEFRRNQLDTMVTNWLRTTYGPLPH